MLFVNYELCRCFHPNRMLYSAYHYAGTRYFKTYQALRVRKIKWTCIVHRNAFSFYSIRNGEKPILCER
jgi:hypothetical protein